MHRGGVVTNFLIRLLLFTIVRVNPSLMQSSSVLLTPRVRELSIHLAAYCRLYSFTYEIYGALKYQVGKPIDREDALFTAVAVVRP